MSRAGGLVRPAIGAALQVAVAAGALVLLVAAGGRRSSYGDAVGVALPLVLALHVLRRLAPAPAPPRPVLVRTPSATSVDTGHTAVEWSLGSAEHVNRVLRPRLLRVADERLRQRHGLDLRRRPEQARQLLGEDLWTMLSHPVAAPPTPAALSALLTRLEQL